MAEGLASESLKEAFATFVARIVALLDTPNLFISPHMGWSSRQVRSRLVQTLAGHLQAYVSSWAALTQPSARHSQRRMNNP